jgi:hypothetical protein
VREQYLDGARNKDRTRRYIEIFRQKLSSKDRAELRDADVRRNELASQAWAEMLETQLVEAGIPRAETLAYERSVMSHTLLASFLVAFRWFVDGGFDSAKESTLTNEHMDADYATLASFCSELLTKEAKLLDEWRDLQAIAELRRSIKRRPPPSAA